ncbi:acyl-CoA dehydrogenase [Chelatococcus asaccharovorans]|uniref:acyl-CoA dehydrogenase n=1 Tax=Chelatococcus asaccharovorans TaxID=28210 RepID=UPI00224C70CE|nr:acyl-CoA dehydrogenase [Chelatococcus asaccharovorans]CAH1669763.1 3-methylmercaptopropionyl-CoA dehydrogenase [Chelatococcus asaccharovorans]CAH1678773.1 3-methylmercaptopropionyl-CoA dehydrogenase [Chelatococcus asaccharovorans]
MTYRAPLPDIMAVLRHAAGCDAAIREGLYGDLAMDDIAAILGEAGTFAAEVIAPLNRLGDTDGARLVDRQVVTTPGWRDAYRAWAAGGWNGLVAPGEWGGQGLPMLVQVACLELWNSGSMAFAIGPTLTAAGIEALDIHGTPDLRRLYLPKLVSGAWMGTMNLTEPQAGTDLSALKTRAERAGDGTYRVTGTKIFITYGDHDLTDNIVHMVLARLPDAPPGNRGISLFLVPKFIVNPDGSLGDRNDVVCQSLEHKLGIHGSPTCVMTFGDKGGATAYLVGEENRGLACMFTMMNNARLAVGVQGVGVAERAFQQALGYARERRQGRRPDTPAGQSAAIIAFPDVRRMLMTMKALTQAARAICYLTASALDRARLAPDADARRRAHETASLLTPIAKAFSTDIGFEVASLGVQVHGGMGYIEETGAAQHLRDARIAMIYEGTNGIQAIDLVTRKIGQSEGAAVHAQIAAIRRTATRLLAANRPGLGLTAARLRGAAESLDRATSYLLAALQAGRTDDALAGATSYLRLFALVQGLASLADIALADGDDAPERASHEAVARFFAEHVTIGADGLAAEVMGGAGVLGESPAVLFA